MRSDLTTCPFCSSGCGVYLQSRNGRLVGVAPSEHHAVSAGRLCARGWAAHEASTWGERLVTPLIRRGRAFEPVSWDEAFAHVARRLSELRQSNRPIGVLGSPRATNEENFLGVKLARAALRTSHVDFCTRSAYEPLFSGIEEVSGGVPLWITFRDVEQSDVVVLLEGDLARTHPRAAFAVMRAVRRGARLVTLGCLNTGMSRLAALHLPTDPGGEGLPIRRLLAAVLASPRIERPRPAGREEERYALELSEAANPGDGQVRQIADWLIEARTAVILLGLTGAPPDLARQHAAELAEVAARTGHLNRPGSGLMVLPGRGNSRGARDMGAAPDLLPGCRSLDDAGALRGLREVWGDAIAVDAGMDAETLLRACSGLVVIADDPLAATALPREVLSALADVEFLVVLDAFETRTSQAAEVVLPIAAHPENDGTWTNAEGRVQRVRATAEPPGEGRPGWAVLAELTGRLGAPASYRAASDVFTEIALAVPSYGELTWSALQAQGGRTAPTAANGPRDVERPATAAPLTSEEFPSVLVREGAFDWGADPLVRCSPTLCRDHVSRRKLYPRGVVEISAGQAGDLGIRQGRDVKLTSVHGSVTLPAALRADLKTGVLLVPFAFREHAFEVLGGRGMAAVRVEGA